jgi:hypothetical protein
MTNTQAWDIDNQLIAVPNTVSGAVTRYHYTFGGARVGMRQNSEVYWLHGDHLGSASLTTNITGAALGEWGAEDTLLDHSMCQQLAR